MPTAILSPGDDSDLGFDGLSADSQHAFAARRLVVKQRGPQRIGMNEPARGSRRPHQGQKRMNAHEVGQRQRGQRSVNAECDQTRLTLRLHSGQ
jgi:hypothetical protein